MPEEKRPALKMSDEEFKEACENIRDLRGPKPANPKVALGKNALEMTDQEFADAELELKHGPDWRRYR
jgi:hypothetical protein